MKGQSLAERFWSKVDKRGPNECWPWLGSKDGNGRGQLHVSPEMGKTKATRVVWFLRTGEWPELCVCHECDNGACVNPAHLWLGTHQDNMADMVQKGRNYVPPRKTHCARGHAFSTENTYIAPGSGKRMCRACLSSRPKADPSRYNRYKRDYRARQKAKTAHRPKGTDSNSQKACE